MLFLAQGCSKDISEAEVKFDVKKIVAKINERAIKIDSIWYKNMKSGFFLESSLFCDKNGKTIARSFYRGKIESEIATDGIMFWFWIKQFDQHSLFFCRKEDISKTRVKDMLRPELTRLIVGIDGIPDKFNYLINGDFVEIEFDLGQFHVTATSDGENIISYRASKNGFCIMTAKILEFENNVPKKITVIWHEENTRLDFFAEKIEINTKKPPEISIPEAFQKVDLLGY